MKTTTFKTDETSICGVLPHDVENALRKLCDDDHFVDAVWGILAAYHDLRTLELTRTPLKEAKRGAKGVLNAVTSLQHKMQLYNAVSFLPSKQQALAQALDDVKSGYSAHLSHLESISGRNTNQRSLRWLAGSLLNIFNSYDVDSDKLNVFIESALPNISPGGTLPAIRSIQTAVSAVRN